MLEMIIQVASVSKVLVTFEESICFFYCLVVRSDGKLDILEHLMVDLWTGHEGYLSCISVSADSKKIVSGADDRLIHVWNTVTGSVITTLRGKFCSLYSTG
jgi:WD40 repeat protein